ncbi:hypothetical protein [Lactiplantibacillus modestisalitolerans]|uniref:Uncharacterized protein n=1 Tax=Lactiplantibacillus modestisalitolerans TaxID=1457219 RepID=A0ABV5WRD0_9LACO|nr:hypothetical protein [Lactiplantibacillus modestisalitolerans]
MTPNEIYDVLTHWQLLPQDEVTWRPFSGTSIFVETAKQRLVYRIDRSDGQVDIYQADPSSELSEHFQPLKTIPLTASQRDDLKHLHHRHGTPVLQ